MRSTVPHFVDGGIRSKHAKTIWSTKCLEKVRMFLWLVSKKVILTRPRLQARGWSGLNICVLCKKNAKTIKHSLLSCEYASMLWAKCASMFNLNLDL